MNSIHYRNLLRIMAILIATLLWTISVFFSQDGFRISVPTMSWIGLILAISVTVIELVWNQEGFGHNVTITTVGLAAYAYGIWTNVVGILNAQGVSPGMLTDDPAKIAFPAILGFFLEITPEPLIVWAFIGINAEDLLSHLFSMKQTSGSATPPRQATRPGMPPVPMSKPMMPPTVPSMKRPEPTYRPANKPVMPEWNHAPYQPIGMGDRNDPLSGVSIEELPGKGPKRPGG